jgi:hypothetical protein
MEYHAENFAGRLKREAPAGTTDQVRRAYDLAFSRRPTEAELALGERFAGEHGMMQFCLVLMNTSEFSYVE